MAVWSLSFWAGRYVPGLILSHILLRFCAKNLFLHLFPTLSSICASYSFSQNLASFQSQTHKNNKSHFFAAGSSGCDNSTRTQVWVHVWMFESSEHDPWNCTSVYHNVRSICDCVRFLQCLNHVEPIYQQSFYLLNRDFCVCVCAVAIFCRICLSHLENRNRSRSLSGFSQLHMHIYMYIYIYKAAHFDHFATKMHQTAACCIPELWNPWPSESLDHWALLPACR